MASDRSANRLWVAQTPRTLRVGLLTPSFLLGGAERWMIALARASDPARVAWTGLALTGGAQSDSKLCREMCRFMPIYGGPMTKHGAHDRAHVIRFPSVRRAAEAMAAGADVLLAWGVPSLGRLLPDRSPPVILVSHGSNPWRALMKASEAAATGYAAVSEAAKGAFSLPVQPRVRVIHNGVDADRCVPTIDRGKLRARWGFRDHHRLIGYVGRYSPEKNPLAAAEAASHLGGDFRAVYIGSGREENETRTGVERIAGTRATFVEPVVQVGDALAALDVMVLASPAEGFSLALTEAWLAGLPTVATPVGAVPELERVHGKLAVTVPVYPTPSQLGEAVLQALSPSNREIVARARRVAWNHFTSAAMAARWYDFLRDAVET